MTFLCIFCIYICACLLVVKKRLFDVKGHAKVSVAYEVMGEIHTHVCVYIYARTHIYICDVRYIYIFECSYVIYDTYIVHCAFTYVLPNILIHIHDTHTHTHAHTHT